MSTEAEYTLIRALALSSGSHFDCAADEVLGADGARTSVRSGGEPAKENTLPSLTLFVECTDV